MNNTATTTEATTPVETVEQRPMDCLLGKHHDITAFASSDATRSVLNSVHYRQDKEVLEATDGRVLIRVPVLRSREFPNVSVSGAAKDCIIPLTPFKRALANIPKCNNHLPILANVRLSVSGEREAARINMVATDLDTEQNVATKPVEGEYPNCDMVIPKDEPKFKISVSSHILKRLAEYAEKHGKGGSDGVGITFGFTDELSPVTFSIPIADGTKATGVAMPMRLS